MGAGIWGFGDFSFRASFATSDCCSRKDRRDACPTSAMGGRWFARHSFFCQCCARSTVPVGLKPAACSANAGTAWVKMPAAPQLNTSPAARLTFSFSPVAKILLLESWFRLLAILCIVFTTSVPLASIPQTGNRSHSRESAFPTFCLKAGNAKKRLSGGHCRCRFQLVCR